MGMSVFLNPLIHTDFFFLGVGACRIFFSPSNIVHEFFCVDRLVKRHPL